MTLRYALDLSGTAAFAASSACAVIRRDMDVFGVLVLGLVTSNGGTLLYLLYLTPQPHIWALLLAALIVITIRLPAVRHNWSLPCAGCPAIKKAAPKGWSASMTERTSSQAPLLVHADRNLIRQPPYARNLNESAVSLPTLFSRHQPYLFIFLIHKVRYNFANHDSMNTER